MIDKDNLIAITNTVIYNKMPFNVKLGTLEIEHISKAVIETITEELAKQLVKEFGRA